MKQYGTYWGCIVLFVTALVATGCVPPAGNQGVPANTNGAVASEPTLEVTSAKDADGGWKIIESGAVTFNVTAPGAESVKLLYRPTIANESEYVRLKEIKQQAAGADGKFTSEVTLPSDFAGEVWAEVSYPGGRTAQTKEVALRTQYGSPDGTGPNGQSTADPVVSARSYAITGGKIETAQLMPGQGNLKITINIPAFQLTLW